MKVVTPEEMVRLEKAAYRDGFSEEHFMESAGLGVAKKIREKYTKQPVLLLVGKGNNGGDAYVAGRFLIDWGYPVSAYQVGDPSQLSSLCKQNMEAFRMSGGMVYMHTDTEAFTFPKSGVVVDGLFGTGFKGSLREPYLSIIAEVNALPVHRVAIDLPSGINGTTGECLGIAFQAEYTLSLGLPKTGLFLADGWRHTGSLECVDFGLPSQYIEEADVTFQMLEKKELAPLLPPIISDRHKYQAGFVMGVGGSEGMSGAVSLASGASLRGGAGIVHLCHPQALSGQMSHVPIEVICKSYSLEKIGALLAHLEKADAVFLGPGLGRESHVGEVVENILAYVKCPLVIDADALFWIGEKNLTLPKGAILTPHRGEMRYLFKGQDFKGEELIKKCRSFANRHGVTLILKGAPSWIFYPDAVPCLSCTGNAGMATAGSGDVLTGLLAALLAQGLLSYPAAKLGVSLHGLAGDFAAKALTPYCMTASDLTRFFPNAFQFFQGSIDE